MNKNADIGLDFEVDLDVDFIGGFGSLTKEDEQKLSEYFKNKKKIQFEKLKTKNSSKSKREKV